MSKAFAITGSAAAKNLDSAEAQSFYALNSQQDYQVERTRKIADAMKNPSSYYTRRAQALEGVKTESAKHFAAQYANLINLNVPHTTAIARATALADGMRSLLMANVEEEWPADINQLSLQLESNKARAPSGFVQPNAAVPSATGGRRKRK